MKNKGVDFQRYILILGVLFICGAFLYVLRSVLLPFVVGIVVAYFLDPLVNKMAKSQGTSRTIATTVVLGLFLLVLLPVLFLICAAAFSQIADFIAKLPMYFNTLTEKIIVLLKEIQLRFPRLASDNIEDVLRGNLSGSVKPFVRLAMGIISNGFEFINLLSLLLISPVVAFYMLRDWHKFTNRIIGLIPRKHREIVIKLVGEINEIISGYLRGQFLVCLSLGSFYSLGLYAVGLDLGLLVGFLAGVISFIPYVGSISGFLMAVILVITQYGTFSKFLMVMIVFGVGQFIEGNFLTPKLVGENIGLHPVWVMFALLAGGVLLGLLGMIIAVPFAAIIGVMLRHLINNYKSSPIYLEN